MEALVSSLPGGLGRGAITRTAVPASASARNFLISSLREGSRGGASESLRTMRTGCLPSVGRGLRVGRSRVTRFYGGVGDFADGLLELQRGERFGFGQGGVAFEGEGVD